MGKSILILNISNLDDMEFLLRAIFDGSINFQISQLENDIKTVFLKHEETVSNLKVKCDQYELREKVMLKMLHNERLKSEFLRTKLNAYSEDKKVPNETLLKKEVEELLTCYSNEDLDNAADTSEPVEELCNVLSEVIPQGSTNLEAPEVEEEFVTVSGEGSMEQDSPSIVHSPILHTSISMTYDNEHTKRNEVDELRLNADSNETESCAPELVKPSEEIAMEDLESKIEEEIHNISIGTLNLIEVTLMEDLLSNSIKDPDLS